MFEDRTTAGRRLADRLAEDNVTADVVLAIPRGGLPVARPVADRLDAPLSVVVARKVSAPGRPELAIGAAAADGTVWLNDDLIAQLDVSDSYLDDAVDDALDAARTKAERYVGPRGLPEVEGEEVLVVDDGVATGATTTACLRVVRAAGADRVGLAVPVGPPGTLDDLRAEADAVYCLEAPTPFGAVGSHYERFDQVSDEEALTYLEDG
jgi:putative phosphoribosyl transferase